MTDTKKRPPEDVLEAVSAPWEVKGVPIRDTGVANVTHAETRDSLRLPRGGSHEATLVAVRKYYDGTGYGGGAPGWYLALWQEFRWGGQRWKTPTLKVRAEEAARVARSLVARKPSRPGKSEKPRTAGRDGTNLGSRLEGLPVGRDGFLLYVVSVRPDGEPFRSRGVEILASEAPIVAGLLKQVAEAE